MSDESIRQAALDIEASIILQAPAGSGKTTILTRRFLALLCTVDQPEQVLAITFTRKAAAEMRRRLGEALSSAGEVEAGRTSALHPDTLSLACAAYRHSRARGWQLEANPSRLRVMTIDGLNRAIAMATPVSSGGAGMLEVGRFPKRLYLRAARRCLEDAEDEALMQGHAHLLFTHLDNDWSKVESLLANMLATRSQWLPFLAAASTETLQRVVEGSLREYCRRCVERVERRLGAAALQEAQELLRFAYHNLQRELAEEPVAFLQALAGITVTSSNKTWRRSFTKAQGFPPAGKSPNLAIWKERIAAWVATYAEDNELLQDLLDVQTMPPLQLEAVSLKVLDSLIALLRNAAAQLELAFLEQREVDYVGIAVAARQALQGVEGSSDLVIHQGESLRHLLIDEFQDTSIEQFEFVSSLVQGWHEGDGRTIFLVGDPMQSIYRFREAEVGLFMRAQAQGIASIKLRALQLSRNFRSEQPVVDFVNDLFAKVFPSRYDPVQAAIPYLASEFAATEPPRIRSEVHCHWFESLSGKENEITRRQQIERVLAIVQDVHAQNEAASIAILVHTRAQAAPIVSHLREAGIGVQGVDLVPLRESPAVQDLLALVRALLWPDDRIAWLAVLRAPWCGLSLADLHALVEEDSRSTIRELWSDEARLAALSADGRARVQRLRELIEAYADTGSDDLARRLERCWLALSAPCAYTEADSLADARRFLDVFSALVTRTSRPTREDLEWMLEDLYATSTLPASRAVQVMTIHAAKGLEFDCVILPALSAGGRSDAPPLLDWITWDGGQPESLLLAPIRAAELVEPSLLTKLVRELHRRRARREAARVLYVAATRAKASLHLLGTLRQDGDDYKPLRSDTPLALLWPALAAAQRGLATAPATVADAAVPQVPKLPVLHRLPANWQAPKIPPDLRVERLGLISAELSAQAEAPNIKENASSVTGGAGRQVDRGPVDQLARLIGICIHRELEGWLRHARTPVDRLALEREHARFRQLLEAEGVATSESERGARLVAEGLGRVLEDSRGRWILASRSEFDAVELELTGRYEGRISSVIIDRCFVEAGERWVIDYKTAQYAGEDLEEFLHEQAELYRPQLARYAHFAARLGPEPVRTALYFVFSGRFIELDIKEDGSTYQRIS